MQDLFLDASKDAKINPSELIRRGTMRANIQALKGEILDQGAVAANVLDRVRNISDRVTAVEGLVATGRSTEKKRPWWRLWSK